ncbi:MAG: protease inhibitor I42 family protein [Thermoleophilia bacterium]
MFHLVKVIVVSIAAVALLLAGSLACGTKTTEAPAPVTVTDVNSGETIELQQGQKLILRLPGNPSTGYSWSQAGTSAGVLTADGSFTFEQDQSGGNPPPPGAGGTEVCTFTATAAGQQNLQLEYKRSWETDVPPAKSVTYIIKVSQD